MFPWFPLNILQTYIKLPFFWPKKDEAYTLLKIFSENFTKTPQEKPN